VVSQEEDFYRNLRKKLRNWAKTEEGETNKWAEYLMVAPDLFHLMWKLSVDSRVPMGQKAKLVVAIAYFVSPVDLLPEGVLGPVGYLDDIAVAALALNSVVNETDRAIVDEYWAGDGDALETISEILRLADEMIGSGLWEKVKGMFI
jgi:uncharacterized membrane protein YkvA (DUF1232 family)